MKAGSRVRSVGAAALCAFGLVGATAGSAQATLQMTPQIDFATDPIAVGQSGTGSISFTNDSDGGEVPDIERIVLEPSCRNPGEAPPCTNRESGIFSIGTGTGVIGTACQGLSFGITAGAMPFLGSLEFSPPSAIPPMPVNSTCVITFTYTALAVPTVDTQGPDGTQTDQLVQVRGDDGGGPVGFGPGTGDTTVNPAPPATPTTPAPTGQRAAALKKCAKIKKKKAKKNCKRKANLLPV